MFCCIYRPEVHKTVSFARREEHVLDGSVLRECRPDVVFCTVDTCINETAQCHGIVWVSDVYILRRSLQPNVACIRPVYAEN